jgi:hypothetical protein
MVEFFAALFFLENAAFALIGVGTLVSAWVRANESRRARKATERVRMPPAEERDAEVAALRAEIASAKELMADLLLELDRQRRLSGQAVSDRRPPED